MIRIIALILFAIAFCSNAAYAKEQKTIKLYGEIDEFSYLTSSAGVKLTSKNFPSSVDKISLGSAAAYSGMREGDKVLGMRIDDDNLVFDIERKGKRYQANVATDVTGLKKEFETRKIPWELGVGAYDKEIKKLTSCELVFLLDRSISMDATNAGVPGDLSKWMWCKQQIDSFYLCTTKFFERGFDIVTFNDKSQRWRNVSLWDLKQVFGRFKPEGKGKDIATPLREVIMDYLHARKPDAKPLVVMVLTDGLKNEGPPLQQVLSECAKEMKYPHQVTVVFLQVGDSVFADELFDDLDRNLLAKGSKYDIAEFKPFSQLRNKGVLFELLSTVKEIQTHSTSSPSRKAILSPGRSFLPRLDSGSPLTVGVSLSRKSLISPPV